VIKLLFGVLIVAAIAGRFWQVRRRAARLRNEILDVFNRAFCSDEALSIAEIRFDIAQNRRRFEYRTQTVPQWDAPHWDPDPVQHHPEPILLSEALWELVSSGDLMKDKDGRYRLPIPELQ
jgi:hypothetical protein